MGSVIRRGNKLKNKWKKENRLNENSSEAYLSKIDNDEAKGIFYVNERPAIQKVEKRLQSCIADLPAYEELFQKDWFLFFFGASSKSSLRMEISWDFQRILWELGLPQNFTIAIQFWYFAEVRWLQKCAFSPFISQSLDTISATQGWNKVL